MPLRIAVGTDHGGFDVKNRLAEVLDNQGHQVVDCGTYTSESTDYPIYAGRVARAVSTGVVDLGVIICRSGNGMVMVANRFTDVRAGLATTPATARLAREHNDANVLVLGCDHLRYSVEEIVTNWLDAKFDAGGRHTRRVNLIHELDHMADSPLASWRALRMGQSIWLELPVSAPNIEVATLEKMVEREGVRGAVLALNEDCSVPAGGSTWFENNVNDCAETLRPVFDATGGDDGYVAVSIDPRLGENADELCDAARQLVRRFSHPNLMVSVPGTEAGIEACQRMIFEGISVHLTGLLKQEQTVAASKAYIAGLSDRLASGQPIHTVRCLLGVLVAPLDKELDAKYHHDVASPALDNCHSVYCRMRETFFDGEFQSLARKGAAPLRLLWTALDPDTDDHGPSYYANALVAPYTCSLMDVSALDDFISFGFIDRHALISCNTGAAAHEAVGDNWNEACHHVTSAFHRQQSQLFERVFHASGTVHS